MILIFAILPLCVRSQGQEGNSGSHGDDSLMIFKADSFPKVIPFVLSPSLFIPVERLAGDEPWHSAPITKPFVHVIVPDGFDGSVGFGEFHLEHPEKFFSTLFGYNHIDVPQMYESEQMMLGNTLRLWKKGLYFMSGILYGAQLGVLGNNWGMGTREGIIWRPDDRLSIMLWSQYFQSVQVYMPVLSWRSDGDASALIMPATPEVFSFGVQASFIWGEFIIGLGTSVAPVPFQKRHHSELRYR